MDPDYRFVTTTEADSYAAAIPGVDLVSVRTGRGVGPSVARSAVLDGGIILLNSCRFPFRSRMTVSDDSLVVVTVSTAPPGTRWCGYDLDTGDTLLYAPGAEHTDISPTGVEYAAAIVPQRSIEEAADESRTRIQLPQRGTVHMLRPASGHRSIASVLDGAALTSTNNEDPSVLLADAKQALVSELSEEAGAHRSERMSMQESRRIVRRCVESVNHEGGNPSIAELCAVAFVSERRLRDAFIHAFGVPPMKYFRDLVLNEARKRLLSAGQGKTVTDISLDAGIMHGGRFARQYFDLFGELPSTTLRNAHLCPGTVQGFARTGVVR